MLAENVDSPLDVPPFDSSAMDGYAVVAGPEAELEVRGESRAGHPVRRAGAPGVAVAISTGARRFPRAPTPWCPSSAPSRAGDGRVRVAASEPGANVRRAGEDLRARPARAGAPAPSWAPRSWACWPPWAATARCAPAGPRVALLVTGDELAEPGEPARAAARSTARTPPPWPPRPSAAGAELNLRTKVPDDREATEAALGAALDSADVVLVSGGVSVGPHDHVKPALQPSGWRSASGGWR